MDNYRKIYLSIGSSLLLLLSSNVYAFTPTLVHSDDFEVGLGNWANVVAGDNNNWNRHSGGTLSAGTGPLGGANASQYYVYLETSSGSAYTVGDSAILEGPSINNTGVRVEFAYHMYGVDIGSLSVDVLTGGNWVNDVWSISGQQHLNHAAAYSTATVDLSAYAVSKFRFRAVAAGSYRGDIAIDDIKVWSGPLGPTAPVFDTDPVVKPDVRQDEPYSDSIAGNASDINGDLLVFNKVSGPAWLGVSSDGALSGTPASTDVGLNDFVVGVSDGVISSTAGLNIQVNDNTTPIVISNSDFELNMGDWSNATSGDNKDWTRKSGSTLSSGTGPVGGANGSQYYMYLETSSGSAYTAGDSAILESTAITASNLQLTFQYHMYGANTGSLAVDVLSGSSWINDVWSISGQQHTSNSQAYATAEVDLSTYSVSKVRFRATAAGGYTGDMAIDNIELSATQPPSGPVAPAFLSDPFTKPGAIKNLAYNQNIAGDATDANGDALSFSKVSGPAWLMINATGALSGTPAVSDVGNNSFVVTVSDGSLSSTATLNIYVSDSLFSTSVYPYTAGTGQDGGINYGWVTDGVIDEFWTRTNYQEDVLVRRYTSLDFTKRSNYWGVYEFQLPQNIRDNAANVVIESASLELDIDGSSSGAVYFHGYLGNGLVEMSDFTKNNLVAEDTPPRSRVTVDITTFLQSVVGQGDYAGFLLKPWDINQDMNVRMWNGTPHPAWGHTSGQISRMRITYRIEWQ